MKKIAYIVPYFGKLPKNFYIWLKSCEYNNTIDWIIFTDDQTKYNYPNNFKVFYTTFENFKDRIQNNFDFKIIIDRPWKICDFRPSFGEIFKDELKEYDYWGYCDIDLIFGDIRKFITDEILDKYERIGFQGHSTLYKNTDDVNSRYKYIGNTNTNYKIVFSTNKSFCFDENGMDEIYDENKIAFYKCVNFAHLRKYDTCFFLGHKPKSDDYKNKRQIFVWDQGHLYRYYLFGKKIYCEEYMYIHFWCRPMTFKVDFNFNFLFIYSDRVLSKYKNYLSPKIINYYGRKHPFKFYLKAIIFNRKKLTLKRIIFNLKNRKKERNSYEY